MTEVLKSFDESNEKLIEEKPVAEEVAEEKEVEEAPEVKAEEVVEAEEEETTEADEEPKEEAEDEKEEGKEDDEEAEEATKPEEAPLEEVIEEAKDEEPKDEEPKEEAEKGLTTELPKANLSIEPDKISGKIEKADTHHEEVKKSAELTEGKQNLGQTLEAILTVVKSLGSTLEQNSKNTNDLSERIAKLEETAKSIETKPVEEPEDEPAEVKEVEEVKPEAPEEAEEEPKEEEAEEIIIPDEEATSKSVKVAPEKVEEVESISKSADGEAEVDAYVSKSADVTENLVEKSEEEEPEKEPELSGEELAKSYAIDNREAVLDKLKAVSRNRQVSSSDVSIYRNAYLRSIDGNGSEIDLQNLKELITLK